VSLKFKFRIWFGILKKTTQQSALHVQRC
jgi:hypothetical protein